MRRILTHILTQFTGLTALLFSLSSVCVAADPSAVPLAAPVEAPSTTTLAAGSNSFSFTDTLSAPDKPVTVWYYKPATLNAQTKVLFVMHGTKRNGEDYRNAWKAYAEKYQFLLVVPEFAERYFPSAAYQFGNVTNSNHTQWSFWVIEHLFDDLRQRESLSTPTYYLYGHSAGAQFVHRFMLFMPSPRVEVAFSANAGSYTMPVYPTWSQARFPMSLDKDVVSETQLATVFSRRLVVMLGEDDLQESGGHVPNSPQARAEGKNRFERGQNFMKTAKEVAATLNAPLKWELLTVAGVGHSDKGMSKTAVEYMFPK